MGYSHFYYVPEEFNVETFAKVAADFEKMIEPLEHLSIRLADRYGKNKPIISSTEISFNGLANCGHGKNKSEMKWPSKTTAEVSKNEIDAKLAEIAESLGIEKGRLEDRICYGNCSFEAFHLQRKLQTVVTRGDGITESLERLDDVETYPKELIGKYFRWIKTSHRPYDLAVTICLVIAKHHLGDNITITSDGIDDDWIEAKRLCEQFLGYGMEFSPFVDPNDEEVDDEDSEPEIGNPQ